MLNRTDKITFNSSANRYIDYTYDAGGNLIRKRQYDNVGGVATLQNTTDYIDGFVYVNSTLSYFPMPEGRVINNSDPSTGSLAAGLAAINAAVTGSGVNIYMYANGQVMADHQNTPGISVSTQDANQNGHWDWSPLSQGGANQGGPGNEVLTGFYNSRYIASDFPFGEKLGIDGAYVGNVSGLGFIVKYTTNSGLQREFPVTFKMANFTIPAYGVIKNNVAASELFVTAYNLAVQETANTIKSLSPETINPFTVRADFLINLNLNLNLAHPGSIFSGGGNASGNFPGTPAQWLKQ